MSVHLVFTLSNSGQFYLSKEGTLVYNGLMYIEKKMLSYIFCSLEFDLNVFGIEDCFQEGNSSEGYPNQENDWQEYSDGEGMDHDNVCSAAL